MRSALLLAAAIAAFTVAADAQTPSAPAIKRTMLQRFDLAPDKEVVTAVAEIPPGMSAGRHFHPGPETSYVIEGSASLEVEGAFQLDGPVPDRIALDDQGRVERRLNCHSVTRGPRQGNGASRQR